MMAAEQANQSMVQQADGVFRVTWKRYLLPAIHPEGKKIVGAVFLIMMVLTAFVWLAGIKLLPMSIYVPIGIVFTFIAVILTIFSFFFFRNPQRITPNDPNALIAPADGLVCCIRTMTPAETLGLGSDERIRVSIFMSVFSVHINRNVTSGVVRALKYHQGKFVNAADKESDENERQEICIEREDGIRVGIVQIAGLVARRIYCPLREGDLVQAGEVFGLIRFGSRLDVYLPPGVKPTVLLGQTTVAGETVIAKLT